MNLGVARPAEAAQVWVHRGQSPPHTLQVCFPGCPPHIPSPGSHQLQPLRQDPSLQALAQQAVLGVTQHCGETGWGGGGHQGSVALTCDSLRGPGSPGRKGWDTGALSWGEAPPGISGAILPQKIPEGGNCAGLGSAAWSSVRLLPSPSVFLKHNPLRVDGGLHLQKAFVCISSSSGPVALQGGY